MKTFKIIASILGLVLLVSACGNKDEKIEKVGKQEKNEKSAEYIDVVVANKDVRTDTICNWTFELKNNTKENFTDLALDFVAKDASGNIVEKALVRAANVAPNGSALATRLLGGCPVISSFEFTGVNTTSKLNGDYLKDEKINLIKIRSASKINLVSSKSNGGEVIGVEKNVATVVAAAKKEEDSNLEIMESKDNGVIFFKPDANACSKVSDMTNDIAEGWARNHNASVNSVKFLRMKLDKNSCSLLIDTATGPMECLVGSVVKNAKGQYLASGYKINADGSKMSVSGMCSKPW